MKITLLLLSFACGSKHRDSLPSQESADEQYVADRLARVCDGARWPQAKPYQKGRAPHAVLDCSLDYEKERWSCHGETRPRSLAEAELIACQLDGSDSGRHVRVIAAATGAKIADLKIDLTKVQYDGVTEREAFADRIIQEKVQ